MVFAFARNMFYIKSCFFVCVLLFVVVLPVQSTKRNKTCETVYEDDETSPEKILRWLSDPCRYDKTMAPGDLAVNSPIIVYTRIHVYHLTSVYPRNLDFKVRILLQFRWTDDRLALDNIGPPNTPEVVCQNGLLERIWIPNVYITNEKHSLTVADLTEDTVVNVLPDGNVILSARLKTSVFCWVKLGRFPFDRQQCHFIMESWRYDTTQLVLEWEVKTPVTAALSDNSWVPYLTEYKLLKIIPHSSEHYIEPISLDPTSTYRYTSLTLTFLLAREYGFYLMDYYVPGILLVTISWVSFWMAPDATPARVAIGASTMLTYFQLGIETGSKLPNVSYIRSNDLWFIVCTAFIFLSLAEFAFVNTIWRYGCHPVKLKSKSNKHMFKSSIKASKISKAKNVHAVSVTASSGSFLNGLNRLNCNGATELNAELPYTMEMKAMGKVKFKVSEESARQMHGGLTTTAQQISIWIDEKSRIIFPASFILFNAVYWSLLWV
ncbi:Neurotransmitter-gated ion-channel, conserved site,Gamma-aminobutyric acid A receptor/Glycine receptor [Cinara cedri]|uniref:Neurotransmitter-gated ion-channel, conserved site,Gamma-aminobutyric acid A receptor/Glycine receptor n=1 Tax=Cinara cedri TaxID=506608 RepID=A0A5E4M4F5_9HEMI|nr:Neurotransmitter-gated ion-channel, conserved site,Gamma-aminobutyric acid A receptor/Glycine receptor [Cinara cedri]